MNRVWSCFGLVAFGLALLTAEVIAQTPTRFGPQGFGFNLTQALINPLEPRGSEKTLRQEIAANLYDVRMAGGQIVRWIVTDVWPQWRCSKDPEDQQTGKIDAAWYIVSRVLLEEAARQNVTVVVSLAHLSNGGFAADSTDPAQVLAAARRMAIHRQDVTKKDGYGDASACSGVPGYYGQADQAALFTNVELQRRLRQREAEMARHLVRFPALGAIELFNEPSFALTATPGFWATVRALREAIKGVSPQAARIPIYSGTAAWSRAIVDAARKEGVLVDEPFVTIHAYDDYTAGLQEQRAKLRNLLAYVRGLMPGKPVVFAEIGASVPIRSFAAYRPMLDTIMDFYLRSGSGVWVWGNWFTQPEKADFAMDFNHRSIIGPAFRSYFFADRETEYAEPRTVRGTDPAIDTPSSVTLIIKRMPETGTSEALRGAWVVNINGARLIGFSRAGVFSRPYEGAPGRFADPPPTLFLSARGEKLRWASLTHMKIGWELRMFECAPGPGMKEHDESETPDVLLGLATDQHRDDVAGCLWSLLRLRAMI